MKSQKITSMIKPIKLIEVKSEIGAGTRGASKGVYAIKITLSVLKVFIP